MKKTVSLFLAVLIAVSVSFMPMTVKADDNIKVTVNGKEVVFPDQKPVIKDGRTLVPLRSVLEEMGTAVGWNAETETASFERGNVSGSLKIGDKTMITFTKDIIMDVAPEIIGGRTMIPIRYPVEILGGKVDWNESTKTVIIDYEYSKGKNITGSVVSGRTLFPLSNNWYYSTASGEKDVYIEGISLALFSEFERIFGKDIMTHKPVEISNFTNSLNPMAAPYDDRILIKLSQDDTSYWAQMIFQLSHEITHYVFFTYFPDVNQSNYDEKRNSVWNEEIICEAMSLYMLEYMYKNWEKCDLYKITPGFDVYIEEYLTDVYSDDKNFPFKSDGDGVLSKDFHDIFNLKASLSREEHKTERNYLYDLFSSADTETICEILNMYKYYNKKYHCIDYDSWIKEAKNKDFIEKVKKIQPKII